MKQCNHPCCGPECRKIKPKKPRTPIKKSTMKKVKTDKSKRVKLIPLPKLIKLTEAIVNEYVRLRDKDKPCVSCGGYHILQAGHFIAVGQSSFLRFDIRNVHGQCGGCNGPKRGNVLHYRIELRKRIGDLELEKLERDWIENKYYKWTRDELNSIIEKYSLEIKQLKAA
jgi:hypothetical protein